MSVRVIFALKHTGFGLLYLLSWHGDFVMRAWGFCFLYLWMWIVMFGLGGLLCCFFLCCLLFFSVWVNAVCNNDKKTKQKTFGGKGKLPASIKMIDCWQTDFNGGHILSVSRGVSPVTTGVNVTPKHLLFFLRQKIQIQHLRLRLHMNKANSCIY